MAKDGEQLQCVDLTEAVDEDVDAAVRFLGQLSGRLVAVEGFRSEPHERVLGAGVPTFCACLWLVEEMSEADVRAVGPATLGGGGSAGWRVWIGDLDYAIWRNACCARRSIRLRYAGEEWWRAQLNVSQPRDPSHLWFSDCGRDPPAAPHGAAIRYGG
ncbi:MAG: hypothetical protein GEU88_19335 [Solirubrobacterales bacterium]|nr:hypothetical protein [Solirubrobacterales bacterium]